MAVPSAEVDRVVIALFAGGIAHRRIHQEIKDACEGDEGRIKRIKELLEAHYPDSGTRPHDLLAGLQGLTTRIYPKNFQVLI